MFIVALYARIRQRCVDRKPGSIEESTPQRMAFSEIVRKLKDCKMCTSDYKVLKVFTV